MKLSIEDINCLDQSEFVELLGWIFEHSPWVAERTWKRKPFVTLDDLHHGMTNVVEQADPVEKLELIRAHPELGEQLQISEISRKEQFGAGLNRLSEQEYHEFLRLNRSYTEKFGFPFVMAVRGQSKETIREALKSRLRNSKEEEKTRALSEIYKIARFRLEDIIYASTNHIHS
jgi:OHCU decarboxylase